MKLISLEEYCPVKRPLDVKELILAAVKTEDEINHRDYSSHVIPRDLEYPKSDKRVTVGWARLSKGISGLLP